MSVSGVDDSSDPGTRVDFKFRNENRISVSESPGPMLTPTEDVALLKGQAFEPLEGGQLWKLRMSLPDTRGDLAMPAGLGDIANEMERPISPTASGSACRSRGGCPWLTFWHQASQWKILMAEAVADPRRTAVRQGLFTKGLATVSQAILWLLFSLLFSIIVEWVGMLLWWPEQGLDHSRTMLAKEIGYL